MVSSSCVRFLVLLGQALHCRQERPNVCVLRSFEFKMLGDLRIKPDGYTPMAQGSGAGAGSAMGSGAGSAMGSGSGSAMGSGSGSAMGSGSGSAMGSGAGSSSAVGSGAAMGSGSAVSLPTVRATVVVPAPAPTSGSAVPRRTTPAPAPVAGSAAGSAAAGSAAPDIGQVSRGLGWNAKPQSRAKPPPKSLSIWVRDYEGFGANPWRAVGAANPPDVATVTVQRACRRGRVTVHAMMRAVFAVVLAATTACSGGTRRVGGKPGYSGGGTSGETAKVSAPITFAPTTIAASRYNEPLEAPAKLPR